MKKYDSWEKQAKNKREKKHVKVNYYFKNRFTVLQNKSETEIDEILSKKASKKASDIYCGLNNNCNQIDNCKYDRIKSICKNEKNEKQKLKRGKYQRDNELCTTNKISVFECKRKSEQNIFLRNRFAVLQNKSETEITQILNQKENKKNKDKYCVQNFFYKQQTNQQNKTKKQTKEKHTQKKIDKSKTFKLMSINRERCSNCNDKHTPYLKFCKWSKQRGEKRSDKITFNRRKLVLSTLSIDDITRTQIIQRIIKIIINSKKECQNTLKMDQNIFKELGSSKKKKKKYSRTYLQKMDEFESEEENVQHEIKNEIANMQESTEIELKDETKNDSSGDLKESDQIGFRENEHQPTNCQNAQKIY